MLITITVISILIISALAWLANKVLPFRICPVCAGVFLTWVGLVGAHFLGYSINLVIPAILMGGSVVGVAYQLEKKFKNLSASKILLGKILFIPAGFVATYGILEQEWLMFLSAAGFMSLISIALLFANGRPESRTVASGDLEKKMEDCC